MAKNAMMDFLQTCEPQRAAPRSHSVVEKVADALLKPENEISGPEDLLYCDAQDIQLESAGQKSLLKAAIQWARITWMRPPQPPPLPEAGESSHNAMPLRRPTDCPAEVGGDADAVLSDNEEYEMPPLKSMRYYPPFICPRGKDHCPKKEQRRKHIKHWLYQAANQGCLSCVRHCIEELGVDPQIESDSQKYTPLDWATWAAKNDVDGANEVVEYLTAQ